MAMLRKTLMMTAASTVLTTGVSSAQTSSGEEAVAFKPMFGDIVAFQGDILPFTRMTNSLTGDITPFAGDLVPFAGDLVPFTGDLIPFAGDFQPFHGDFTPFYGDISPFWGDITPFWGDIMPFRGDTSLSGDIVPFWGDLIPFADGDVVEGGLGNYWAEIGPMWGDIYAFWGDTAEASSPDWENVRDEFAGLVSFSAERWGTAVAQETGKDFYQGFANELLSAFGLDLDDPASFAEMDAASRSAFFMAWYDGLMAFSGIDQIDHWMPQIGWSPLLTQEQGAGRDARVGLIDASISLQEDTFEYLVHAGGYEVETTGHGAAVASLIAARHDGQGTMGIAPNATVYAYNPFDATGTADTPDIADAVSTLAGMGVSVINMSLGVPGATFHQDLADVMTDPGLRAFANDVLVVTAAGNEGAVQTTDVVWGQGGLLTSNLILVGSVDVTGQISSFSNRPGEACFVSASGNCAEGDRLMDRFLVAPGELLLVADNQGGTMRASGTSFAAPLVTGAISLLHDRWPWLQQHPEETAEIIFATAQDLGEEGVDAVYGHGLLDVEASQSPIDFADLTVYAGNSNIAYRTSMGRVKDAVLDPGTLDLLDNGGYYLIAFENVGDTSRDFRVPLSQMLHGVNTSLFGRVETFQRHVARRLMDWAHTTSAAGFAPQTLAATREWSLSFTPTGTGQGEGFIRFHSEEDGLTMVGGLGTGLHNLSQVEGFTAPDAFDPRRGGANPMLGLAAGGSFAAVAKELTGSLSLTVGYAGTPLEQVQQDLFTGAPMNGERTFAVQNNVAAHTELSYAPSERMTLGFGVTALNEGDSVLGAQGGGALAVGESTSSVGLTLSGRLGLTERLGLSATATGMRALATDTNQAGLGVAGGGILASSFRVEANMTSLLKEGDRVTLAAIQPLNVEAGALSFNQAQVTDRETGELGMASNEWGLSGGPRHLAFESAYAASFRDDRMQLSAFTRYDLNDVDMTGRHNALSVGARLAFTY
ncbi:S8 family peptidase [Parvularcula maris]|uniref:S8 family serine peptidase n=1 Tax=Parvularcula maris TaxID=2965077 RepID=A0A9X2L854_9PROT|nr:S8 family peptidase [Parvularcula maris]MCQ8184797.1 S8 family serine peptidase [Parvularcula maris]